ncbi:MAG: hypothetical protein AAGC69_10390 [Paracraurococcus sp.]|jgi:hypothetical protein
MRIPRLTIAAVLLLAAGPAFADDSDIPGIGRSGAQWQRSTDENPEMKPYMQAPPAQAPMTAPVQPVAAPAAMAPGDTRHAALKDADQLLHQAEGDIAARNRQQAGTDLAQARLALQNAKSAGDAVPASAMQHVVVAEHDLRGGQYQAALRATTGAEHIVESAQ